MSNKPPVWTWALTAFVFCLIGFILVAMAVTDTEILRFDTVVAETIQGWESSGLTAFMKTMTLIGSGAVAPIVALVAIIFLYMVLGHRRELLFLIAVMLGSEIISRTLKLLFHRARPIVHRIAEATGYSFPSGHTTGAVTLYGTLVYLVWRHVPSAWGRALVLVCGVAMIVLIGVSRIYLGVHYPSDVVGGLLISGAWLAAAIWFYTRYFGRTEQKHTFSNK